MLPASGAPNAVVAEAEQTAFPQRHSQLLLWLIVAAGAVLRLIALGHRSFWIDEIASVAIAQKPGDLFWRFLWHDEGNMAAYYILLRPWLHLGYGEATVRLLSVLPGVVSIPALYHLAKRLFGVPAGLLSAALFALNPCAIGGSQEARAYSFVVLGVIVSTLRFVRLAQRPCYRFAVAYGVVAGVTCYFHYFGILVPAAHAVSLIVVPRRRLPWKQYLVAGAIIVVLTIPILWLIHAQDVGHISWVQPTSWLEVYHLGVFLAASGGKVLGAILLACDLALIALFLRRWAIAWREGDDLSHRWAYTLAGSTFFSPIVIVLAASIVRPVFYHRFLVICLPAWVMMTAVGVLQIRRGAVRVASIVAVAILCLVNTVQLYSRVVEDWHGAVSYLIAEARPQDRVLYYQSLGAFAAENYWNWLPGGGAAPRPKEVDVQPGANWEVQLDHAPRVWLVLYRAGADDAETQAVEQELSKAYSAGEQKVFRGVTVIEYDARR